MPGHSLIFKRHHWLFAALAVFCCALVAFSGIVQIAHTHPTGQWAQSDCALCHTAHIVVQPAVPQPLAQTVMVVARVSTAPQPVRAQFFFVFSLFTRPPPVDLASA